MYYVINDKEEVVLRTSSKDDALKALGENVGFSIEQADVIADVRQETVALDYFNQAGGRLEMLEELLPNFKDYPDEAVVVVQNYYENQGHIGDRLLKVKSVAWIS